MKRKWSRLVIPILVLLLFAGVILARQTGKQEYSQSVMDVPDFSGKPYVVIQDNQPEFSKADMVSTSYEQYSPLDDLGRCGYAMACIGTDLMPTEDRGAIGQVKPSGWQTVKYDFVDGKYLYNRCHLIGFQLTGENANEKNLITGTRYMNVEGMLPFENMVADYVRETENHVVYRVTPVFDGSSLVARGVQMEAKSVEDGGEGICFNVYVYNNQPGVTIDYATGTSTAPQQSGTEETEENWERYILNISSKKFHKKTCEQGKNVSQQNRETYTGDRDALVRKGYTPAKCCNP